MATKIVDIVFFGTSDFGIPTLQALLEAHWCKVIAVVTQPDRPVGRKQQLQSTPIKEFAEEKGLLVIHELGMVPDADVGVLVSYGAILPQSVLDKFPYGIINVHPSLLPQWRGPAPMQYALLHGDTVTGVSIMKLDKGVDTGPLLSQEQYAIPQDYSLPELSKHLEVMGAHMLERDLRKYIDGEIELKQQVSEGVSRSHIIKRSDGKITGSDDPRVVVNTLRAYTPWPGVFGFWNKKRIKILDAHLDGEDLILDKVQIEGKQPMKFDDFKRGYQDFLFTDIV